MGYSKLAIWSLGRGLNPRPCGALFLPFRLRGGCSLLRDASTRLSHRGTKSVRGQYFDLKLLLTTIDRHIMTGSTLGERQDRKSTRLNSSHTVISYAVFCLKKK